MFPLIAKVNCNKPSHISISTLLIEDVAKKSNRVKLLHVRLDL